MISDMQDTVRQQAEYVLRQLLEKHSGIERFFEMTFDGRRLN